MSTIKELPSKVVDVGWKVFDIKIKKELAEKDEHLDGCTDFRASEICVDEKIKGDYFVEVLLHEIMHAVLETVGLGDNDNNDKQIEISNEDLTQEITKGLLLLFRNNPELSHYLVDKSYGLSQRNIK